MTVEIVTQMIKALKTVRIFRCYLSTHKKKGVKIVGGFLEVALWTH